MVPLIPISALLVLPGLVISASTGSALGLSKLIIDVRSSAPGSPSRRCGLQGCHRGRTQGCGGGGTWGGGQSDALPSV